MASWAACMPRGSMAPNSNQLRGQVARLRTRKPRELKQENATLLQRFVLSEQASGDVTRRVGALEVTMPKLIEAVNTTATAVDHGAVTASTGTARSPRFDADGGTVGYTTTPMTGVRRPPTAGGSQPMPRRCRSSRPTPTPSASRSARRSTPRDGRRRLAEHERQASARS